MRNQQVSVKERGRSDGNDVGPFVRIDNKPDFYYYNEMTGVKVDMCTATEMPGVIRNNDGSLIGPGDRQFGGYWEKIDAKTGEVVESSAADYKSGRKFDNAVLLEQKEQENKDLLANQARMEAEIAVLRKAAGQIAGDGASFEQTEEALTALKKNEVDYTVPPD